jgi:pSer/pThr/pTyr-binding forkhead associated (FHA) protein
MAVCPNGHDSASDDFCDTCGMRIGGIAGTLLTSATGASSAAGAPSSAAGAPSSAVGTSPPWPDSAAEPCPRCGTPRTGQFCEACGFNFSGPRFTPAGPPPPPPPPPPATASYSQAIPPASKAPPAPSGESSPSTPSVPASPSMSSFPYPQATWTAVVGADRAYYERVQGLTGPEGAAVTFPSYCAERRFQLVGSQMRIGRRSVSRGLSPEIDLTGPPADPGISRLHAVLIATPGGNWAVLDPGSANGTLVNGSEIGTGDQVTLHDGDRINLGAWTAITVHRGLGNSLPAVGHRRITTGDPRH